MFGFEFVQGPGHKHVYFAWRYLEQAAELVAAPPKDQGAIMLELERYLIGAALSLELPAKQSSGEAILPAHQTSAR